jgi:hypothetical protein
VEENVTRRTIVVGLLVLGVALAACGGSQGDSAAPAGEATMAGQSTEYISLSRTVRLGVGTLMLEDTTLAVTGAQAEELLPLWQMLGALQESSTASELEVEAVLGQIEGAMTAQQLAAIEEMDQGQAQEVVQALAGSGGQSETDTSAVGASPPPDAMMVGGGEGSPGMSPEGLIDLGPTGQTALLTEGNHSGSETVTTEAVVELLETRLAGA